MNAESNTLDLERDPLRVMLDVARRVCLLLPSAARFDALAMQDPIERLKIMGKAVVDAANENEHIHQLVVSSGFMNAIREVALQRTGAVRKGELNLPQLRDDAFTQPQAVRELH